MNGNFGIAAGNFMQAFLAARMAKESKEREEKQIKLQSQLFELKLRELQDQAAQRAKQSQDFATQKRLAGINRDMIMGEAQLGVDTGQFRSVPEALANATLQSDMRRYGFDPAKDFGVQTPTGEEQEYLLAQRDPGFLQYQLAKRAAGATQINTGDVGLPKVPPGYFRPDATKPGVQPEPGVRTPGQEAADSDFAKIYNEWVSRGGWSDVNKQLEQLRRAADELRKGGVTGPAAGMTAQGEKAGPILNPRTVSVRDAVLESAQRNLRLVLGPQFTQKEGEALLSRVFNPFLPDAENLRRVEALIQQIEQAANATDLAARHFERSGTLSGYKGMVGGAQGGLGTSPPALNSAPVVIQSDEEFNRLPSGTMFIGPDGLTRRKP